MKHLTKIGGIFIVLVALALLVGTSFTFAQDDDTDTDTDTTETDDAESTDTESTERPFGRGGRGFGSIDREAVQTAVLDTLGLTSEELKAMREEGLSMAEILEAQGVTEEDIQAAVLPIVEEALETAVTEGTITQEQADQILERAAESNFLFKSRGNQGHSGRGFGGELFGDIDMKAIVADALGITVEELEAYREDGLRFSEIAEELGVDVADVQEALQTAREEAINQALEDGTITEEQAERLQEGGGRGFGRGGRGGHGGPRGGGFGNGSFQGDSLDDSTSTGDA